MADVIQRRDTGPSGEAIVKVLKKGVRVEMQSGEVYDVDSGWNSKFPSGKYVVSISRDKDRIIGIRPPKGQYVFEFKQMGNRTAGKTPGSKEPGLPIHKIQRAHVVQRRDGKGSFMIPEQLVFIVEVEVVRGPYSGLTATTNLPFSFAEPKQGDVTAYSDSSRNLENLEKFFLCTTGRPLADIDIEYTKDPTSLLLAYEEFIKSHSLPFVGQLNEKGFLEGREISPLPADLVPAKKAVKKASRK